MGRLIDIDEARKEYRNLMDLTMSDTTLLHTLYGVLDNAPTVEAIPKAEVKKFLEEGTKDVSNNVLAIVREDYIHKADYEKRLKADMVAMLTEIQLEIEELQGKYSPYYDEASQHTSELIQQKIDKLKEAD